MGTSTPVPRVLVIGAIQAQYKEADAAEAITPGHLVDLNGSAGAVKNDAATTTGALSVSVAVENDIFGGGYDDAYAIGDRVIYATLRPGCEFMGFVPAAAVAIVFNDYLTPTVDGCLIKGTSANAVARARTAVDNSGGGAIARIRAEVL